MGKYAISRQFYPFTMFQLPIRNASMASFMGSFLRVPGWLTREDGLRVQRREIPGYKGETIEVLILEPEGAENTKNCLVYFHGGGFLFPAAGYHYRLAVRYAKETPCKVVFVQYRLTPNHPFPVPVGDCYAAFCWARENLDCTHFAVGGDSAGGALAAAVAQMARDRLEYCPLFQLLVYPVTDRRMDTESNRRFTDTPMWNSKLSAKMWEAYLTDPDTPDIAYASPMEAGSFAGLPPAYVETTEFDCLHDEGLAYAKALRAAGVSVWVNETLGTMHGFDIVQKAPITQAAVAARIDYMREMFHEAK